MSGQATHVGQVCGQSDMSPLTLTWRGCRQVDGWTEAVSLKVCHALISVGGTLYGVHRLVVVLRASCK